jgi:hypothetical protein
MRRMFVKAEAGIAQEVQWIRYSLGGRGHMNPFSAETKNISLVLSVDTSFNADPASHISSAWVKNVWSYNSAPPYVFVEWRLIK